MLIVPVVSATIPSHLLIPVLIKSQTEKKWNEQEQTTSLKYMSAHNNRQAGSLSVISTTTTKSIYKFTHKY